MVELLTKLLSRILFYHSPRFTKHSALRDGRLRPKEENI